MVSSYNVSNGNFNWFYTYNPVPDYGYEEIDGLTVQTDGVFLTGWKQQANANDMDFLIQKIDFSGNLVWTNTWDYNSLGKFDGANGHCEMDNNFIYAAGHVNRTNISSLDGDGALVCFSRLNGNYQWHVTWGGALYDDALGMTMSSDSMLYVTGYTGSFGNGSQNYLNKYTRTGQLAWSKLWGGSGTEDSRALVTDADSIIYVVGTTSSYGNGAKDIFVLKYDSAGTRIDSLFWGGVFDETAKDVAFYNGYLYITGETESFGNGLINGDYRSDGLLLKINGRTMQAPDSLMTAAFDENNDSENIIIYPNPSGGIFTISCPELNIENAEPKIYDVLGREMRFDFTRTGMGFTVQNGNFTQGIYLMKIQTPSGVLFAKFEISE